MKKILLLAAAFMLLTAHAWAQTPIAGSNLTWKLEGGILTISGTGAMPDFDVNEDINPPWYANRNSVTAIVVENGVTSIGDWAFFNCTNVISAQIPTGVKSMGFIAFGYCYKLKDITIPGSVKSLGIAVFNYCQALETITIPDEVTDISESLFDSCENLTTVTILGSVKSIGGFAFSSCFKLNNFIIPEDVEIIGEFAFQECKALTTINIPASVATIAIEVFNLCSSLASITVDVGNNTYSSDGGVLFNKTKTELLVYPGGGNANYTIPENVTGIGTSAFFSNEALTSVVIPNNVANIGEKAFGFCSGLNSITILRLTPASVVSAPNTKATFRNANQNCTVTVPTSAVDVYKATPGWNYFTNIVGGGLLVVAASNNNEYGNISGTGLYTIGTAAILTATANEGFKFKNWTDDDGNTVSTDASYNFTPDTDIKLTANFEISTGTSIDNTQISKAFIYPSDKKIIIRDAEIGSRLLIVDVSGRILVNTTITTSETVIPVGNSGVYIVKINTQTAKISCK